MLRLTAGIAGAAIATTLLAAALWWTMRVLDHASTL